MSGQKRSLLLVGSPRGPRSTSESLGAYLLDRLRQRGWETDKGRIGPALKSEKGLADLLRALDDADLLIVAFPLYVDSLPAPVIRFMELVADRRKSRQEPKRQRFLAIANNGFPEADQNDTALAICRRFALETGLEWVGGLALGMGGVVSGRALSDLGGMVRNVTKALDLTAGALADGERVPAEAVELMARPLMPIWMYTFMGNVGWIYQARKHGVRRRLKDRPYQG
jgi:multimeric flavodoxin WrbA